MKHFLIFSFFLFLASVSFGQSAGLNNSDTINRVDSKGYKQGQWIVTGKQRPELCSKKDQVLEEGRYINNKKTGLWIEYYCNGTKKNEMEFVQGKPDGKATLYFQNGAVSQTGTWKNSRWKGKYQKLDSLGKVLDESIK